MITVQVARDQGLPHRAAFQDAWNAAGEFCSKERAHFESSMVRHL
jgi:hypothetical protein